MHNKGIGSGCSVLCNMNQFKLPLYPNLYKIYLLGCHYMKYELVLNKGKLLLIDYCLLFESSYTYAIDASDTLAMFTKCCQKFFSW